jgi:hypothetical protein
VSWLAIGLLGRGVVGGANLPPGLHGTATTGPPNPHGNARRAGGLPLADSVDADSGDAY